jgi:hypothetical protein
MKAMCAALTGAAIIEHFPEGCHPGFAAARPGLGIARFAGSTPSSILRYTILRYTSGPGFFR